MAIQKGIIVGLLLAFAQSLVSTFALKWAWDTKFFYWIWGGGVLFRMFVFAVTAFVVYSYTQLSFVATLGTMVVATTIFLVVESAVFLKPNRNQKPK